MNILPSWDIYEYVRQERFENKQLKKVSDKDPKEQARNIRNLLGPVQRVAY